MLLRPVSHFPTVVEHVSAEGTCIPGEWHSSSYCLLRKEKEKKNADQEYISLQSWMDGTYDYHGKDDLYV